MLKYLDTQWTVTVHRVPCLSGQNPLISSKRDYKICIYFWFALSRGMPIPSDLSDFPLASSCGIGTYVFEISWMCVSRLENCNIIGVECGKIIVFEEAESYFYSIFRLFFRKTFSKWKSVALPIRISLINNPAYVYTLWVTIIHLGGRGSEIVVRKIEGMLMGCYGWENGYLSSRENANLLQSGISKLEYSTLA
jgi:hypothetical protein